MPSSTTQELANKARKLTLASIHAAGSGHPGGSLSAIDILMVLFHEVIRADTGYLNDPARHRCILSKGHAAPALYAVGALVGLHPVTGLKELRKFGSPLQGHPHVKSLPWVETSTGSLGQGFSVALGMALGLRHRQDSARVFALLGDGEMQEGEIWEGLMAAAHFRLTNLCAILDYNKLQSDNTNANIMGLEPLADKIRAFGWQVVEVDGHDLTALAGCLQAPATDTPRFIIAHTCKGKGVSFMENHPAWHGSVKLSDEDLSRALADLGATPEEIGNYLKGDYSHA